MDVKLSSEEMEQAVIEFVQQRIRIPDGFALTVSSSYIPGVTVYMEPVPAEIPVAEGSPIADAGGGTIPAGAD
jgi:hypothetical protein